MHAIKAGRRRLDDPLDFVRLETAAALKRDIPVVPVLVQGASMPRKDQLPADLENLAFRNAIELTHARWDSDLTVLVKALGRHVPPLQPDAADRGDIDRRAPTPALHPQRRLVVAIGITTVLVLIAAGVYFLLKPSPQSKWHVATFPPPNAGQVAFTIMPDGNPACASYDQFNCLWGVAIADLDFSKLKPLVCGEMHRAKYNTTGYDDPKHWCSLAKVVATSQ